MQRRKSLQKNLMMKLYMNGRYQNWKWLLFLLEISKKMSLVVLIRLLYHGLDSFQNSQILLLMRCQCFDVWEDCIPGVQLRILWAPGAGYTGAVHSGRKKQMNYIYWETFHNSRTGPSTESHWDVAMWSQLLQKQLEEGVVITKIVRCDKSD